MPDSESEEEPDSLSLHYKVIILGDGATGKTSIAMRFTDDHFAAQYKQTIGVDFFSKRLTLPGDVNVSMQARGWPFSSPPSHHALTAALVASLSSHN